MRLHRVLPTVGRRESPAFYRILGRHQDGRRLAKREISGDESMMVGKRVRNHIKACRLQLIEKTLGASDTCHRVNPSATERFERQALIRVAQSAQAPTLQMHRKHGHTANCSVQDRCQFAMCNNQIDLGQTLNRLAQGPGWQQEAVTQGRRIEDDNLNVASEAVVLQAIISHHGVAVGVSAQELTDSRWPITTDDEWAFTQCGKQYRFVTIERRVALGRHRRYPFNPAPVSPADDARAVARSLQPCHQPLHHRRLAAPTHGDVTDHDDGNRKTFSQR